MSGMDQEGESPRTIVEVSKLIGDIKTKGHNYLWEQSTGNLFTGWVMSGIEMARA